MRIVWLVTVVFLLVAMSSWAATSTDKPFSTSEFPTTLALLGEIDLHGPHAFSPLADLAEASKKPAFAEPRTPSQEQLVGPHWESPLSTQPKQSLQTINPLDAYRPSASGLAAAANAGGVAALQMAWQEDGAFINLERKSPQHIESGEKMKFVATLTNPTTARMNVVAEVLIRKGDGSLETLIPNYNLKLGQGKALKVPVGMAAKTKRFPPGMTQFVAFLRDQHGSLIDQASITFRISVPLN